MFAFIYITVFVIIEIGAKKFGVSEVEVRQVMASRISNLVKVQRAKEKLNSKETEK